MEGFDLSCEHNFWQILTTNRTFVLATEHSHSGATFVTYRVLAHANAVNVNILVAHHTGIISRTIGVS